MKYFKLLIGILLVISLLIVVSAHSPMGDFEGVNTSLSPDNTPEGNVSSELTELEHAQTCDDCLLREEDPQNEGIQVTNTYNHPLMTFTLEEKEELRIENQKNLLESDPGIENVVQGSRSLLAFVPYTPSERDQGMCGDCWVWAGTACLEVDRRVEEGLSNRLSIQYLNSNYYFNPISFGPQFACCGGSAYSFRDFYNDADFRKVIPWSNTNAAFADGGRRCTDGTSARAYSSISTSPSYAIESSITVSHLNTHGVGESAAIAAIKSQIDQNKPVYYAYWLSDPGWDYFILTFWNTLGQSVIFDPDPYNGVAAFDGHGVVITGYNDNDPNPANHYWEVLNSWGMTASRPNGVFRLKMHMNYDGMDSSSYYNHEFYILNVDWPSTGSPEFKGVFRPSAWNNWIIDTNIDGTVNVKNHYGQNGDIPVVGDFNNDGIADRAVFRPSAWNNWIIDYGMDGLVDVKNHYGQNGDIPVVGDFNNDGIEDRAVFRPSAWDNWIIDYNFNGDVDVKNHYGQNGDIPVVGDFNNDGVEDRAVFRPSAWDNWIIDYNFNGDVNVKNHYGQNGDIPVVGDFNKDLKTDRAVFRPSSFNNWIVDYSCNGDVNVKVHYGQNGDIPFVWNYRDSF